MPSFVSSGLRVARLKQMRKIVLNSLIERDREGAECGKQNSENLQRWKVG